MVPVLVPDLCDVGAGALSDPAVPCAGAAPSDKVEGEALSVSVGEEDEAGAEVREESAEVREESAEVLEEVEEEGSAEEDEAGMLLDQESDSPEQVRSVEPFVLRIGVEMPQSPLLQRLTERGLLTQEQ
jgi:hypothetical protein